MAAQETVTLTRAQVKELRAIIHNADSPLGNRLQDVSARLYFALDGAGWTPAPPTSRKPLNDTQITALRSRVPEGDFMGEEEQAAFTRGIEAAERYHGIGLAAPGAAIDAREHMKFGAVLPYLQERLQDHTCERVEHVSGAPELTLYITKLGAHPEYQLFVTEAYALWFNLGKALAPILKSRSEAPAAAGAAQAVEVERNRLRAEQAASVMPQIGPLLDAWDSIDNDTKSSIREVAPQFARQMGSITRSMLEDAPVPMSIEREEALQTLAAYVNGPPSGAMPGAVAGAVRIAATPAPEAEMLSDDQIDALQEEYDCFGECDAPRIHDFARGVEKAVRKQRQMAACNFCLEQAAGARAALKAAQPVERGERE